MLKLYGPARSRSSRVLWMLAECGVSFEHEDLTRYPTMADKAAAMREVYPLGKLPVLEDGELTLAESMAINLYLAQHYGPGLWPDNAADQALALQWSFFAASEIDPPIVQLLIERSFRKPPVRDEKNEKKQAEAIKRPLAYLDGHLAKRPYLLGDRFTVADLNLASVFTMAAGAKLDMNEYPHAKAWLDRCYERPAFKEASAPAPAT